MKVDKSDPPLLRENMKEMGHGGNNLVLSALLLHSEHFLLIYT